MRAKCVYENLEFERGGDPKEKMRIGQASSYIYDVVKILTEDVVDDTKPEYTVKEGKDHAGDDFQLVQIFLPTRNPMKFIKKWGRAIHEYHNNHPPLNSVDRTYVEVEEATGRELSAIDIVFYSKQTNEFFGTDSGDLLNSYHYIAEQDAPYLKDYKKDMPGGPYGVILNLYMSF